MSNTKPNYFTIIPPEVRYDSRLTHNTKLIYGAIAFFEKISGVCYAENSDFEKKYNLSKSTVVDAIKLLEDLGYISREIINNNSRIIRTNDLNSIKPFNEDTKDNSITKPRYYAIIPAKVSCDSELSSLAKLFYGEITCLTKAYGVCFAGDKYFANLYNIDKRQVRRIIKKLADKGYITKITECRKRIIKINDLPTENIVGMPKNVLKPTEKCPQGMPKNVRHNNNIYNNKNNITADFALWYEKYPRKEGQQATYTNYCSLLKKGFTHEQLITARDNYIKQIKQYKLEERFIKTSVNFLNPKNKYFEDYISVEQEPEVKTAPPPQSELVQDEVTAAFSDEWYNR